MRHCHEWSLEIPKNGCHFIPDVDVGGEDC